MKKVLFVAYGGGHAPMLLPVIRALKRQTPGINLKILALTTAKNFFLDHGEPCTSFRDLLTHEDGSAIKHGKRLVKDLHSIHTAMSYDESVAYLGLSYADLENRLGIQEARRQYAARKRKAFLPITVIERLFDQFQPDLVVTTNSPRAEQAAREVAVGRNIPLIVVTDLIGSYSEDIKADVLCVSSNLAKEEYARLANVNVREIKVVGNPAMDGVLATLGASREALFARYFPDLNPKRRFVLSAEQESKYTNRGEFVAWEEGEVENNLDKLLSVCVRLDAGLMVRPHPSLDVGIYQNWINKQDSRRVVLATEPNIHESIACCDVVLGNNSTVLLDALYMQKPVVVIYYDQGSTLLPFDNLGMAYKMELESSELCVSVLDQSLNDESTNSKMRKTFLRAFPPPPAGERIAGLIQEKLGCSVE